MSITEQKEITKKVKNFSKYFKIEVKISIFGQPIIHWVYPPQKEED